MKQNSAFLHCYRQGGYGVQFERGEAGLRALARCAAVIVIADVTKRRFRWRRNLARSWQYPEVNARRMLPIRCPSPNGATLTTIASSETTGRIVIGCLRNASAVAAFARAHAAEGPIAVISAGERWPNGTLRPALEDDLGAGAIIAGIGGAEGSPEACYAARGFLTFRTEIGSVVDQTVSGRELIEDGYADDVRFACALDESQTVPLLGQDGFISDGRFPGKP